MLLAFQQKSDLYKLFLHYNFFLLGGITCTYLLSEQIVWPNHSLSIPSRYNYPSIDGSDLEAYNQFCCINSEKSVCSIQIDGFNICCFAWSPIPFMIHLFCS